MSEVAPKKPEIKYRVELEKRLEINKSYKERRNRAIALRILSYGLFGQKRFQNLYLSCSLNCFYWALQIANFLHQRVAGLAMIIRFEQVLVIEYYATELESGKTYSQQKYTKILIKLTRSPSEEDKKEPGYNPGFNSSDIKDQLIEVLGGKKGDGQGERPQRGARRARRNFRGDRNRGDRGDRERGDRGDRERGDRGDRERDRGDRETRGRQRGQRDRGERGERGERGDRVDRRDRNYERRNRDQPQRRNQRRQKDEYRQDRRDKRYEGKEDRRDHRREGDDRRQKKYEEKQEKTAGRHYGDDRDERRRYKEQPSNQKRGEARTRGRGPSQKSQQRPKYEQRPRQDRGDRHPRRKNRYSDEDQD